MARRPSRSRPASLISCSEPTGSASRAIDIRSPSFRHTLATGPCGHRAPVGTFPTVGRRIRLAAAKNAAKRSATGCPLCPRCGHAQRYFEGGEPPAADVPDVRHGDGRPGARLRRAHRLDVRRLLRGLRRAAARADRARRPGPAQPDGIETDLGEVDDGDRVLLGHGPVVDLAEKLGPSPRCDAARGCRAGSRAARGRRGA